MARLGRGMELARGHAEPRHPCGQIHDLPPADKDGSGRARPLQPSEVVSTISLVERFIELQPRDVDEVLFNALLDSCCRLKDLKRLEATRKKMKELRVVASPVTLGVLVKTYGQAGDLQRVLRVWDEMEEQRVHANAVTYGCMIDACVKCGHLEKAVEIFDGMRQTGKHRNTILYTTLIRGYGSEKNLEGALLSSARCPAKASSTTPSRTTR